MKISISPRPRFAANDSETMYRRSLLKLDKCRITKDLVFCVNIWLLLFVDLRIPCSTIIERIQIVFGIIYIGLNIKHLLSIDLRTVWLADISLLLFSLWIIIAGFINSERTLGLNPGNAALLLSLKILVGFFGLQLIASKGKLGLFVASFTACQCVTVLLNDMLLFIAPHAFGVFDNGLVVYLVGGKFSVAVAHMLMFATLFSMKRRPAVFTTAVAIIIGFSIAFLVMVSIDCMTGAIGITLYFSLCVLLMRKRLSPIHAPLLIVVLLLCTAFICIYEIVLLNPNVQWFIQEVLGKSADMTGRAPIYEKLMVLLPDNLLWGFGYGTGGYYSSLLGGADTQNGLIEWVWAGGVPAAVFLVFFIYYSIKYIWVDAEVSFSVMPYYLFLMTICLLCTVEVLLDIRFMGVCMLLSCIPLCSQAPAGQFDSSKTII